VSQLALPVEVSVEEIQRKPTLGKAITLCYEAAGLELANVNIRAEKHGDDSATAIDLKFSLTTGNSVLNRLAPGLREALYYRSASTEGQAQIDGIEELLPDLRFPAIESIRCSDEIVGAKVCIEYGIGGPGDIHLAECKVNAFRIECLPGGSVEIGFRVQTSHIPEGALDKLGKLLDGEANITLLRPELTAVPSGVKTAPAKKPKVPRPDATQAFLEEHAA
jgi:hypothetical protein